MSTFFEEMTTNDTFTANGAVTHSTSANACLDLFFLIGASRGQSINSVRHKAFYENPDLTTRIMLWARDIRQGAGERQHIRDFIQYLEGIKAYGLCKLVINKLPELGRWDDMLAVQTSIMQQHVASLVKSALANNDALCAKWMPRESSSKRAIALWLMKELGVSAKQYRKLLSSVTNVVESKMCKNEFSEINYQHVPSRAMLNYTKCFKRRDEVRFKAFIESLAKGEVKINAGAVYPNEVLYRAMESGNDIALPMWKALPNFLEGDNSILPVCDVSGSMGSLSFVNTPKTVSVALGLYIAERNKGAFKDLVMTFCGQPELHKICSPITDLKMEATTLVQSARDMNTNLQAVFDVFLQKLKSEKLSVEEMPKTLLIISDMHFDDVGGMGRYSTTNNFDTIKRKYTDAGYPMPNLVFWNVDGTIGNVPVKRHETGTALVSGYSPSILKSVLGNEMNPMDIMLKTVMSSRYDFN